MKGEALITIKTKDGKVKQQVKNTNLVFDLPKLIVKEFLQEADIGLGGITGFTDYSSATANCPLGAITCYEDWFRSIKINDKICDTTDPKDWKMPVLYGGEIAKAQSGNDRYAYYDANNSNKNNNVMKKVYTWNNCPAFTIKSINLGHYSVQGTPSYNTFNGRLGISASAICKYGKFYFLESGYNHNANFKNVYYNRLYTKGNFAWGSNNKGTKKFNTEIECFRGNNTSSYYRYSPSFFALRNNEIAILRRNNDLTTDEKDNPQQYNYLFIIDANTGNTKRSFPLTQFSEFTGYPYSTPHYATFNRTFIIATDFGSFLLTDKTGGSNNNAPTLWKIPEQSEMENYSNNESIPVYADLSSIGVSLYEPLLAINEYIIKPTGSYSTGKTLKINDDPTNPITVYNYVPFNMPTSNSSYEYQCLVINKYYKKVNYDEVQAIPKWYNTTVLNLSEGVEVAQGDTVTIEYTITAN